MTSVPAAAKCCLTTPEATPKVALTRFYTGTVKIRNHDPATRCRACRKQGLYISLRRVIVSVYTLFFLDSVMQKKSRWKVTPLSVKK